MIAAFTYRSATVPAGYVCEKCAATGVKLWRDYSTFLEHITLLCTDCAEQEQGRKYDRTSYSTLGWRVAAIPTEDGGTFWGYTSVPEDGIEWWNTLPLRSSHRKS